MTTVKTKLPNLANLPCTELRGVGAQMSTYLQKLGINTVQDLLFHLPSRYQDRTRCIPIGSVRAGDHVVITGQVTDVTIRQARRRSLLCQLNDNSGTITLRFFHFNQSQWQSLMREKKSLRCFGEVRHGRDGFEMVHPEYRFIDENQPMPVEENLTPIYPSTEGIQQTGFRRLTDQALTLLQRMGNVIDYLPEEVRHTFTLPELIHAITYVHRPPPEADKAQLMTGKHPTQQRLAFEELLAHHLSRIQLRIRFQQRQAPIMATTPSDLNRFLQQLPFTLTSAQQRVMQEIHADLSQNKPMLRLVQGDVGSGKTVVAAMAAFQTVISGYQVAVMTPTELLAEQHFASFRRWFEPLNISVAFLASRLKASERRTALAAIADGSAQLVVGTHALFQQDVQFARLGLVIIDEQHRFGVQQRLALWEKGRQPYLPHQLIMTATPIPRTLAMTAYTELDYSVIDELPPGRKAPITVSIANTRREEVIARIFAACRAGRQAYWVCTLITESEVLQCQAAEATAALLMAALPELRLGLIHGRLKPAEKDQIMQAFRAGNIDLLIATTVIEVGVDVPNATLMVIENPERLGLSQLHQLRGRIGRGHELSHCVLLYQLPLSYSAKQRLSVLKDSSDGFVIAEKDLQLRGPGDVLGTRQTGLLQLRIADVVRDQQLLPSVQKASTLLLKKYPEQVGLLIERWIAQKEQYAQV